MGLFGINLGFSSKKEKYTRDSESNKTETGTQAGTEATSSTSSTNQSQTGTTTNQSAGTTSQAENKNVAGTSTQTQTGSTNQSSLDQGFLDSTQEILASVLGDVFGTSRSRLTGVANQLQSFNAEEFVNSITGGKEQDLISDADTLLSKLSSDIGGTDKTNTMAALLGDRINRDTATNLASIRQSGVATANQILQGNLGAIASGVGGNDQLIPSIIAAIKGANVTGTNTAATQAQTAETSTGTSTGTASESSTGTSATNLTSQQTMEQLVSSLLSSETFTNLIENVKGTGKSSGITAGLSIGK